MTFLNATLIMGVAAIAVPIVLHLIAKREPKKVVFPSIHFLTKRYDSTRSRLRVRRWWLLALRIAAIAALAIALARPVIDRSVSTTWLSIGLFAAFGIALLAMASVSLARGLHRSLSYSLAGAAAAVLLGAFMWAGYAYASGPVVNIDDSAPVAIAIVLDNSPTSAWKTAGDDRNQRMKEVAGWMVSRVPRTSRITIVDRSSQPLAFSLDAASAMSKIAQVRPQQVTQPLSSRLDNAARLLRTSELTNRQIFIISDLSESTWADSPSTTSLLASFAETPSIAVNVFDLGEFDKPNRSLSLPRVTDTTPAKGVATPVSITLQYTSPRDTSPRDTSPIDTSPRDTSSLNPTATSPAASPRDLQVTAEMQLYEADPSLPMIRDDEIQRAALRNVDRTSVKVSPGSSHELVLTIPPLDVGTHHGQIRLVGDDAIVWDDVRYFTVQVLPPSSVLLVSDDENAARAMGLTMTAPLDLDDPASEFLVQRIATADLPVVQVEGFDAIVLIDPPRETLRDEVLVRYVQQGGGLLVCLGRAAGDDPMPQATISQLVRRWRVPQPGTFFQIDQPSHPAVAMLAAMPGGVPWNEYRVMQYWQVSTDAQSSTDPQPQQFNDTTLIRMAGTEHPAVLQRDFLPPSIDPADSDSQPQGRCLIVTTPLPDLANANDRWNDLYGSDAWPAFVLVRQMTDYVTGRGNQGSIGAVGTPHVVQLTNHQSSDRVAASASTSEVSDIEAATSRRLQLFTPGNTPPVPINIAFDANQVAIRETSVAGTYWLKGDQPNAGFSLNMPVDPVATQRVEASKLDLWFGAEHYNVVSQLDEIELAQSDSASRVVLHSPAMLLALIVFLLEQILGNRFYPARSVAASPVAKTLTRGVGAA